MKSMFSRVIGLAMALVLSMICLIPGSGFAAAATGRLSVVEARTNDLITPLGIDDVEPPVLSWRTASTERGVVQTAYRVRVATAIEDLPAAHVWDSGTVDSREQLNITLEGGPLQPATRYYWQVKVWDNHGYESDWSEATWFETALGADAWAADWIGADAGAADLETWSDYRMDAEFTLTPGRAFGIYLRTDPATANGYMWQLNDEIEGKPRLRPHVKVAGVWSTLPEVDLTAEGLPADVLKERGTLSIALEGSTITTWVDGVLVSEVSDATFTRGYVGPRTDVSTHEEVLLHSLSVTSGEEVLYDSDFENGENPFDGGTRIVEGALLVKDQVNTVYVPATREPLLRREFNTLPDKQIESARIYASSKGIYELAVNGSRVGDQELAPGSTDYTYRIQYQTYDVTDQLVEGANALGAWLGTGWYAGHIAWFGNKLYGDRNSLIAQLVITYTDGTTQTVASDDAWMTTGGPIVSSDLLMGETYDARFEQVGWDEPGFDDSRWSAVWLDDNDATALLRPQIDQPVRVVEEIRAQSRAEAADGTFIYDFGQNLTGVVRIDATGHAGETVTLRHGEVLNPDGSLYTANLRSAKATDHYTFSRDETATYTPRFTQHGFRYVEVTGVTTPPALEDVTAEVFSSDLPRTGTFSTSDSMLNQLQSNIFWGQRGNFISVPTDTPARDERLGYSGDLNAFIGTATFNMDSLAFVKKWMRDMRDTQERIGNGAFPESAPRGPGQACCSIGTAWSDGGIVVPWTTWERYGDRSIVEENWDAMVWYMEYLAQQFPDHIRVDGPFGDWLNLNDNTPDSVLGTAYYAYDARLMSQMAQLLGKDAQAAAYADLEKAITDVFVAEFVSEDGTITGESQTAYALSLGLDLVPDDLRAAAGEHLVDKLASRDFHLSTGFVGTPWLMPALSGTGNWDTAYRLLMTTTMPSWGYEVVNGATTMWERWDSIREDGSFQDPGMNSFNHYAFGAVGDWMYQNIGGIKPLEPGYKKVELAPRPGGGLTTAETEFESAYGTIATDWTLDGDDFAMTADVPVNVSATVRLPADNLWAVSESGAPLTAAPGVTAVSVDDGEVVVEIGSGSYEFLVDGLAGSMGTVIALAQDAVDNVSDQGQDGALTPEQATHLLDELAGVVDDIEAAVTEIRTDRGAAVSAVLGALGASRELRAWITTQAIEPPAGDQVVADVSGIESALTALGAELSGLTLTVEVTEPGPFTPAERIPLTVTIENTGEGDLSDLHAQVELGPEWSPTPVSIPMADRLSAGEAATQSAHVIVPAQHSPGDVRIPVAVTYTYEDVELMRTGGGDARVESGIVISAAEATPATVTPGTTASIDVTVVNESAVAATGRVQVDTPTGWVDPLPSPTLLVEAGEDATVTVDLFIPLTLSEEQLELPVFFDRSGTTLARGATMLSAEVPAPPADVHDHIDLGDSASEAAHNLTASPKSGVNTEAGLSRRYSSSEPHSFFAFEMDVPRNEPFIISAIETFDGPRLKEYAVSVDGVVVQDRLFQRIPDGAGLGAYQILVDDPAALSDSGTVTLMFQRGTSGNYDPSLADVWTAGVGPDTVAPNASATLAPALPNGDDGWYVTGVEVELAGVDDRPGPVELDYRLDGGEGWTTATAPIEVGDEGTHVLEYRATDGAGNTSDVGRTEFRIDVSAPETTVVTATGDDDAEPAVAITLVATDSGSGVASTQYALEGGTWRDYDGTPIVIQGVGNHEIRYRSTDHAGNQESARMTTLTIEDRRAPTLRVDAPAPNSRGWLGAGATVTLTAEDEGSAIAAVEYRFGEGEWQVYDAPIPLPEGEIDLEARAGDSAGNVSAVYRAQFAVDATAPGVWSELNEDGHLTSVATDALSGIQRTEYSLDGNDWVRGLGGLPALEDLPERVWVRAVDKADNVSPDVLSLLGADPGALQLQAGDALHLEANGFAPGDVVRVELQPSGEVLGRVTVGSDGVAFLGARAPSDLKEGGHRLVLIVEDPDVGAGPDADGGSDGNGIDGGGPSADDPQGATDPARTIPVVALPETGTGTAPIAWAGIALLGLGLAVVAMRRRLSTTRPGGLPV